MDADGNFQPLVDSEHEPIGIDRVVTHEDRIEVFYTVHQTKVITAVAHEDETYAKAGIHFGPSGGQDSMVIMWTDGKALDDLALRNSNIWIFAMGEQ
jgi:hypothetical protein